MSKRKHTSLFTQPVPIGGALVFVGVGLVLGLSMTRDGKKELNRLLAMLPVAVDLYNTARREPPPEDLEDVDSEPREPPAEDEADT